MACVSVHDKGSIELDVTRAQKRGKGVADVNQIIEKVRLSQAFALNPHNAR